MMRKLIPLLAVLLAGSASLAQDAGNVADGPKAIVLARSWDLDGEAASAAKIVAVADAADSTTYTIAAQPDVCRLIDMTVTDANSSITAGVITLTGTDCLGTAITCTQTFTGAGSGVKTLVVSSGSATSCYMGNVASVISGALTGEQAGTDKITVGYTTNSSEGWPMYGVKFSLSNGVQGVNPFAFTEGTANISTSGLSTTISGTGAFTDLLANDLIWVMVDGRFFNRRIVTRTSANAVVVDQAINIPSARSFKWQKFYFSTNPLDEMWVRPNRYSGALVTINVDANVSTGGVVHNLQCYSVGGYDSAGPLTVIGSATTATGAAASAGRYNYAIERRLAPFSYCKLGFYFGTGDDADGANESITATVLLGSEEYVAE